MTDHDIREMLEAAIRCAKFRNPKTLNEFIAYLALEMDGELAEAWGRQRSYC